MCKFKRLVTINLHLPISHSLYLTIFFWYPVHMYLMPSIRINLPLFSTVLPSNSYCFCPVGQKQQLFDGRTVENKGKLILNTFKYHVFAPMGRFQLESIYLYFPPSSQLLYLCFCPVGLSLL